MFFLLLVRDRNRLIEKKDSISSRYNLHQHGNHEKDCCSEQRGDKETVQLSGERAQGVHRLKGSWSWKRKSQESSAKFPNSLRVSRTSPALRLLGVCSTLEEAKKTRVDPRQLQGDEQNLNLPPLDSRPVWLYSPQWPFRTPWRNWAQYGARGGKGISQLLVLAQYQQSRFGWSQHYP